MGRVFIQHPPHVILGNRWILAQDTKQILPPSFQPQRTKTQHFVGFVYVDHTAGLSVNIECFCNIGFRGRINPVYSLKDDNSRTMIRFDVLQALSLRPLNDEEIRYLKLDLSPSWLEHYSYPEVEPLRVLPQLHPLRAPGFPDDVKFILMPKTAEQQPEQVWGRLVRQTKEGYFECELLNHPNQDLGYKIGDHVIIQVAVLPQGVQVLCLGHANDDSLT